MANSFTDCNTCETFEAALFYIKQGLNPVRVYHKDKKPVETGWQKKVYEGINESDWGGNIGIRGDESGLMGIDCDDVRFKAALLARLPMLAETLQSRGKKETGHFWVRLTKPLKNESIRLHFENKTKQTFADLRGIGGQIVVAPSIHPEGPRYRWLNNNPILPIQTEVFLEALDDACLAVGAKNPYRTPEDVKAKYKPAPGEVNIFKLVKDSISIQDYLGTREERIDCPVHKEETPSRAMRIYPKTNSVYCFSCGFAGDIVALNAKKLGKNQLESVRELAKKHNIIQLPKESLPKLAQNPSGQVFTDTTSKNAQTCPEPARGKAEDLPNPTPPKGGVGQVLPAPGQIGLHSDKPVWILNAYQFGKVPAELLSKPEWLLENIVPKGGKGFISAPVAVGKSTVALYLAVHLAAGAPIWDGSVSKPQVVWYVDEEDTWGHIIQLAGQIKATLKPEQQEAVNVNFYVSSGQGVDITKKEDVFKKAREIKPTVIFVDSFRKLATGDENESQMINDIDSAIFSPLVNELGVTWMVVHHNSKRQPKDSRPAEDIERMRGSGALGGIATIIVMLEKLKEGCLGFYIGKNKWGQSSGRLLHIQRDETMLDISDGGELKLGLAEAGKLAEQIIEWLLKEERFTNIKTEEIKGQFGDRGGTLDQAIRILKERGDLIGMAKNNRSPFKLNVREQMPKQGGLTDFGGDTDGVL